jgi:hypothetical protein
MSKRKISDDQELIASKKSNVSLRLLEAQSAILAERVHHLNVEKKLSDLHVLFNTPCVNGISLDGYDFIKCGNFIDPLNARLRDLSCRGYFENWFRATFDNLAFKTTSHNDSNPCVWYWRGGLEEAFVLACSRVTMTDKIVTILNQLQSIYRGYHDENGCDFHTEDEDDEKSRDLFEASLLGLLVEFDQDEFIRQAAPKKKQSENDDDDE